MERVSSGTILLGFIAVLCGLLGVYSLRTALRPVAEVAKEAPRQSLVPMASRDLEPGHRVSLGDVALIRMTRAQMKSRGITGVFMSDPKQIIGRTLQIAVGRGITFDTEDFYPDGVGPGIASKLNDGERAVTISIVGADALIGFAGAGQVVDVLFKVGDIGEGTSGSGGQWQGYNSQDYVNTWRPRLSSSYYANRNGNGNSSVGPYSGQAVTLMQGVRVMAIENNAVDTPDQKPVHKEEAIAVTLAVSPDQAEVLRVVEGAGEISLSLRNPEDSTMLDVIDPRTLEEVLGIRQEAGPRGMEVYRGHNVNRLFFGPNGALTTRYPNKPTDSPDTHAAKTTSRVRELAPTSNR